MQWTSVHGHETNLEVRMSPSVLEDLNFSRKIILKHLEVLSSAKGFTPIALMQWEILDELLITHLPKLWKTHHKMIKNIEGLKKVEEASDYERHGKRECLGGLTSFCVL